MSHYQLHFHILSYWHSGSGRGGGAAVDAVVHKDHFGLPELPGRSVKGLVRDAVERAEAWGRIDKGLTKTLFGSDARNYHAHEEKGRRDDAPQAVDRYHTQAGDLVFDNAVLPQPLSSWLRDQEEAVVRGLYRHVHATAINPVTGAAQPKSLRGMEVVVPLELFAPVSLRADLDPDRYGDAWVAPLRHCLPLIRALGLQRGRGLGRCQVTLEVCP